MRQNKIRCALAGLGRIGVSLEDDPLREKPSSHMGGIEFHPHTLLVAASDPDARKRQDFEKRKPACRIFADTNHMIHSIRPDILHIATDTDSHMPILSRALDEGVPVIVCEKPLANSLSEARAVEKKAASSGSRILVNHERRFSRDYQKVRSLIQKEAYGRLLGIHGRLFMGRSSTGARILYHDGTHMLDILRFLTGEELEIRHSAGEAYKKGGGLVVLAASRGVDIMLEVSGGRDHLVFELDLSFERGRIRLGNGLFELWDSCESPHYSSFRSLCRTASRWEGSTAYFSSMIDHAVQLFRNPGMRSASSFHDAFEVMKLIDTILQGHQ